MTKHVNNNYASSTNRGVEAKEIEIANTHFDRNTITSSSTSLLPAEGSTQADSSGQTTHPTLDVTGSYVQVVVQKHRRARAAPATSAAQTSPRLPAASSPIRQVAEGAGDGVLVLPASVLLACPPATHHQHPLTLYNTLGERAWHCGGAGAADVATSARAENNKEATDALRKDHPEQEKVHKTSWKILNNAPMEKVDFSENAAPERVEVYYFDRGCASHLATCSGPRATRVERAGRKGARVASALLAELFAAAQLLLALPVALLVSVERCVLMAGRDLVMGSVQTAADYALKPALALAFNALAAPALVCAGNAARALRDALRPLWQALTDAAEPGARLLGQLRFVQITVHTRCRCEPEHV